LSEHHPGEKKRRQQSRPNNWEISQKFGSDRAAVWTDVVRELGYDVVIFLKFTKLIQEDRIRGQLIAQDSVGGNTDA